MSKSTIRRVEKPWGYEEIFANTPRYAAKFVVIIKGRRLSLQYHEKKEESLFLLSGRVHLLIGRKEPLEKRILEPGDCLDIPAGMLHRFTALEDCRLVEVSTPELDDVVRVADDYGREGRGD